MMLHSDVTVVPHWSTVYEVDMVVPTSTMVPLHV